MTDEVPESPNSYEELKTEMASQLNELKEAFSLYKEEKEKELTQLKEDNKNLQRALIKETFSPSEAPKEEPSEDEIYAARIQAIADRSKQLMKEVI